MNITKKVAIVTGASRGIGAAITKILSSEGYSVVGVYENNEIKAVEVANKNKSVEMVKADVSIEAEVKKVVRNAAGKYGRIDVLVNNAGIAIGGNIENFELNDWNRLISVNLTGKFLFAKYTIPFLKKTKGVIINISSRGGLDEFVFAGFIGYSVTNAGINNLTLGLAKELREDGVRVNAIIPTVTDTDRFKNSFTDVEQKEVRKAGKLGAPEEVAELVYESIIDKSKTGEIIIDKRVYIQTKA